MPETIQYLVKNSALGLIAVAASPEGICFAEFGEDQNALIASLKREFPGEEIVPAAGSDFSELDRAISGLAAHMDTGAALPDLPLDIRGTDFERQVWQGIAAIPAGKTRSYSQLAQSLGRPEAPRAVASACGRNRIAVLIPCHRVLRSDGNLGGYRWGLERKQALLNAECAG
jgi:AraC family transcriptional regulator of adaptative response/methylated-DNA-[protein]-cysteine methyltransferase